MRMRMSPTPPFFVHSFSLDRIWFFVRSQSSNIYIRKRISSFGVDSMGRDDFVQPPWVYSPSEVMNWINATHPSSHVKKSHVVRGKEKKILSSIELSFDINVEQTRVVASNFLLNKIKQITGYTRIQEHFEVIPTAELIVRGLAKAKFHNMIKILLDGKTIYDDPKNGHDLRKTIQLLMELSDKTKDGKIIELRAKKDNREACTADITIRRIHPKKIHAVDIVIKGGIEESLFHEFLNYIKDHLQVKSLEEKID
jgi:hypothetical protein